MHLCVHACSGTHIVECACVPLHVCIYTVCCVGGDLLGAALWPVPSATPLYWHPGEQQKGRGFIWKKEKKRKSGVGVQWSNGQQCRFYWRGKGTGHRLGAHTPIYQSFWQNSGPLLSRSVSVWLIRHAQPWNDAWDEGRDALHFKHIHTNMYTCVTHTRG